MTQKQTDLIAVPGQHKCWCYALNGYVFHKILPNGQKNNTRTAFEPAPPGRYRCKRNASPRNSEPDSYPPPRMYHIERKINAAEEHSKYFNDTTLSVSPLPQQSVDDIAEISSEYLNDAAPQLIGTVLSPISSPKTTPEKLRSPRLAQSPLLKDTAIAPATTSQTIAGSPPRSQQPPSPPLSPIQSFTPPPSQQPPSPPLSPTLSFKSPIIVGSLPSLPPTQFCPKQTKLILPKQKSISPILSTNKIKKPLAPTKKKVKILKEENVLDKIQILKRVKSATLTQDQAERKNNLQNILAPRITTSTPKIKSCSVMLSRLPLAIREETKLSDESDKENLDTSWNEEELSNNDSSGDKQDVSSIQNLEESPLAYDDDEPVKVDKVTNGVVKTDVPKKNETEPEEKSFPELDPDVAEVMEDDVTTKVEQFAFNPHFTSVWKNILAKGLPKEKRDEYIKKYSRKGNLPIDVPLLNQEVSLMLAQHESVKKRDKYFVRDQEICGSAMVAIAQGLVKLS
ncbi:hypothetical protein HCN44_004855 [Aphidius gifuensis]|uniref:Uncharacterized protein n=1 Tax=Aphidius gifuensis TaxID=684658 RepID=A0A834XUM9_APHGI|nr:hypothetical protein HCN44_004855 [Aphidius gifuensis]